MGRIGGITRVGWGWALGLWLASHTGVSHADDAPVVAASQAPASSTNTDGRHWRRLDLERPPGTEPPPPRSNYTGWLIASYLAVPALGIGVPVIIAEMSSDDTAAQIAMVAGLAVGAMLPAAVHWSNGDTPRGTRDAIAVPLITAGGILGGAAIGAALTSQQEQSDDDLASLEHAVEGGLIGLGITLTAWAVFDVLDTASESNDGVRDGPVALGMAVAPMPGGVVGTLAGRF